MSQATLTQSLHTSPQNGPFAPGVQAANASPVKVAWNSLTPIVGSNLPLGGEEMTEGHYLLNGEVHVYKRAGSSLWQCSTYREGRDHRKSTGEADQAKADQFATEWYIGLRTGMPIKDSPKSGKRFEFVAQKFITEFEIITEGERSPMYVQNHRGRIKNHLLPYFGKSYVSEITSGMVQEYRAHRIKTNICLKSKKPKKLSRSTLHQEIVCLRQILTVAEANGWIKAVPTVTPRYKSSGKVTHRAWFSPEEYETLRNETRRRAANPSRERYRDRWETLHDYVLLMTNTGLRPDEAGRIEFRDVAIVYDAATKSEILEIEVHKGKRGVGYCKSMPGAVLPFKRLKERRERTFRAEAKAAGNPDADTLPLNGAERLFPFLLHNIFNIVLNHLGLKHDREGQVRTSYSLRHTYICLRLMEGANIYQIAKNCRTSVEMIEKFYAAHIKDRLDAEAINVMKPRKGQNSKNDQKASSRPKRSSPQAEVDA